MFSRMRKHVTYANVAMTLAIVLAMGGGAFAAARYKITSIKQIKPNVVAALKGEAGPVGPQGPAGKDGTQGASGEKGAQGIQGPAGPAGAKGVSGPTGPAGVTGLEGPTGPKGVTGSPWVPDNTLPVGATETGEWSVFATAAKTGEKFVNSISFPIQLASIPAITYVKAGETPGAECPGGTAAEPKAASGNLCVFEGEAFLHPGNLQFFGSMNSSSKTAFGPGKVGVDLIFSAKVIGEVSAVGSWAVTG